MKKVNYLEHFTEISREESGLPEDFKFGLFNRFFKSENGRIFISCVHDYDLTCDGFGEPQICEVIFFDEDKVEV